MQENIKISLTSHQKMGLEARFHVWTDRNVNRERMMVRTECSRRRNHGVKKRRTHTTDDSLKRKNVI